VKVQTFILIAISCLFPLAADTISLAREAMPVAAKPRESKLPGVATDKPQNTPLPVPKSTAGEPAGTSTITVSGDQRISVNFDNRALSEILRMMSGKKLFDINGPVPPGEPMTIAFTELTLEQALKKMLRGYNYILMDRSPEQRPLLMVMGIVDGSRPTEQRVVPAARPETAGQQPDPKTYYVPPTVMEQEPIPANAVPARAARGRTATALAGPGGEQTTGTSQGTAVQPGVAEGGLGARPTQSVSGDQILRPDNQRLQQSGQPEPGPASDPAQRPGGPDNLPQPPSPPQP